MESSAGKIDEYISIVRELTENGRESECNESSLIQIARNLGLTMTDWQVIEQKFEEYCIRAENYFKHQQYIQTIEQCQFALQIKPLSKKALILLVRAYLFVWQETKNEDDKVAAIFYAEKVIQFYPNEQDAYALLQQIQNKQKNKLTLMFVFILAMGITAAFFYFNQVRLQKSQFSENTISLSDNFSVDSMVLWQKADYTIRAFGFDTAAYRFNIYDSRLEKYNQKSMAIKCRAIILVNKAEIHELKFELRVLDANKRLLKNMPIPVIDYQPAVRSGDVLPFDFLFFDSVMPVFPLDVQIIQNIFDVRPLAANYPKAKIITIGNADEFSAYQLQIRERRSVFTISDLMNQTSHKLSIELENMGTNYVQKLLLKIIWQDNQSQTLSEKSVWVNISDMPPMMPNQNRVFFTIETFDFKKTSEKIKYIILFEQIE
jgi:hypothetical protein